MYATESILLKCTNQWILVYSESCTKVTTNLEHRPCPQKKTLSVSSHSPFTPSQTLAISNLLSVSVNAPLLDVSDKWNHTVCGVWRLASSTWRVFVVSPGCSRYRYRIPFQGWITPHWMDMARFVHSSADKLCFCGMCVFTSLEYIHIYIYVGEE